MEVKRQLKDLGLSTYEIEVYLKVVELGIAEARTIYQETNVPFGRIYQELNSLASKGLIEVQNSRPKRYMAREPRLALEMLVQRKRENIERQLQQTIEATLQLEEILTKKKPREPKERTFWTTAIGVEEAKEMLISSIEEAAKEICVILHHEYSNNEYKGLRSIIRNEIDKVAMRGVSIKALLVEGFLMTEMEFLKELETSVEMRVMKDAIPSYFGLIDGEKVILRVVNPKNPVQILAAMKIWNIKLATVLREKFEDLWREAKPLELS